jgi:hypothetical protein
MQGENATAAKLADFLLAQPKGVREWRMIGRVKTQAAAEKLLAAARAKSIEAQLAAFPVTPKREKKSPEDAYVVGTAEITGYHADVRFQVVLGTKPSADFLIEYTMTGEKGSKRMWHVFTRAKTEAEATRYVEQLRRDYDMLDSQRQAVAQAYNVRTTRRC